VLTSTEGVDKIKRYRINKRRLKVAERTRLARDVLYDGMVNFETRAKQCLAVMIDSIKGQQKSNYAELKLLYQEFRKCQELAADYAHKLAPYQSPKLESIEVKSQVEHRYVMRVPHQMKSTDEWTKATGASKVSLEEMTKHSKNNMTKVTKDVVEAEYEEDNYVEPGMVH